MCCFRRLDIFYFLTFLCLLPALINAVKVKIEGKINVNDDIADVMLKVLRSFNINYGMSEAIGEPQKKQRDGNIGDLMLKFLRTLNINYGMSKTTEETKKKQQEEQNQQNKKTEERNKKFINSMTNSEEIGIESKENKHKKHHTRKEKKKSKKHINHIVVKRST